MQGSLRSLNQRYGSLASTSWAPLFEAALACRRELGIQPCEGEALGALLLSHRAPGVWESIAQETLARRLGVSRTTVNHQVQSLRKKGLIAVSPDLAHRRHPLWEAPLRYCLDPYLVVLASAASKRAEDAIRRARLDTEAIERFGRFFTQVGQGAWKWRLGDLRSTSAETTGVLARTFAERYGLPPAPGVLLTESTYVERRTQ